MYDEDLRSIELANLVPKPVLCGFPQWSPLFLFIAVGCVHNYVQHDCGSVVCSRMTFMHKDS